MIVSALASGVGKTTFTMGLLRVLKRRGVAVQPFKAGPDYIDPAFHLQASGEKSYNLPMWMIPDEAIAYLYEKHMRDKEMAVIEGVMGYYDGRGDNIQGSTAALASLLKEQTLLLVEAGGSSLTVAALLQGMVHFVPDSCITGVIFTGVKSAHHYRLIREHVMRHTSLRCYGYFPTVEGLSMPSRNLGLVQAQELDSLDQMIERVADTIEDYVEVDQLLVDFGQRHDMEKRRDHPLAHWSFSKPCRIGVARDVAFSFYYEDNLELLEEMGSILVPFSPLTDEVVPDVDALYFGGGYPEEFMLTLMDNQSMVASVRQFKGPIYAECGGLMYMGKGITDLKGTRVPMLGIFDYEAKMTKNLQHFGLVDVEWAGVQCRAHEFHRSTITMPIVAQQNFEMVYWTSRGSKRWPCGYFRDCHLASYAHVHFYSSPAFTKKLLNLLCKQELKGI